MTSSACVRIMAEAEDEEELNKAIETLRSCVLEALGGPQPHG